MKFAIFLTAIALITKVHAEAETASIPVDLPKVVPPNYSDFASSPSTEPKIPFKTEVNKLMHLIINSLYKTKEIFLRELISNASDALDKIRFIGLTNATALAAEPELKIEIVLNADKRMILITDTGIGMTKADLINNLGTIAKSGTAEFMKQMEIGSGENLIGQFGVGFYSVFLVADSVSVISKNDADDQYIWESNSENDFTLYKDPRGNTLKRGTQIVINVKKDAEDFLKEKTIRKVIKKHSQFINFPILLWTTKTVKEPIVEPETKKDNETKKDDETKSENEIEKDEVENVKEDEKKPEEKFVEKTVYDWVLLNENKPIWMKNPSEVSDADYNAFYRTFSKYGDDAMSWTHFKTEGDFEFRGLLYIPKMGPTAFLESSSDPRRIKLFVKRVFITDELKGFLPHYLTFVQGMIDSDDFPLNVSRETLQHHVMLKTIKKKVVAKILERIKKIADEEPEIYKTFIKEYNTALKYGIVEDPNNLKRLSKLFRVQTSYSDEMSSLDDYVKRMKIGQPQIYYVTGTSLEEVKASPFVEKLVKRGYEVIYFVTPIDEVLVQKLDKYEGKKLQSAAKSGLKYGDEDSAVYEKEREYEQKFQPLKTWMQGVLGTTVTQVVISNRLVESPCTIVAGEFGFSGLMEKLLLASNTEDTRSQIGSQIKIFEFNPSHPIMAAMLAKVDKPDEELEYTLRVLFDSAMLRSGYALADTSAYVKNVERIVRENLGVGKDAVSDMEIKPAPEVVPEPEKKPDDETDEKEEEEKKETDDDHDEL